MSSVIKSSVTFRSNVYPVVSDQILYDEEFLHSLRDPIAVREFEKHASRYYPSPLQNTILRAGVGIECTYSEKGDLAWGTILDNGVEKVVCRCENSTCRLFPQCRPSIEIPQITATEDEIATNEESAPSEVNHVEDATLASENTPKAIFDLKANRSSKACENSLEEELQKKTVFLKAEAVEDACPGKEDYLAGFAHGAEKPAPKPPAFEVMAGRYDEHQAEIVRANPDDRIYVNAGPGSGKTHTLIEKIGFVTIFS